MSRTARIDFHGGRIGPDEYDEKISHSIGHGELLQQAIAGDEDAWVALVDEFSPTLWAIARAYNLDHATARDVAQTVWLRLVEGMSKIDDPRKLPGWLATTCRRECQRIVKANRRHVVTDLVDRRVDDPAESSVLRGESSTELGRALLRLDQRCRRLLRLLTLVPPLSYEEVSEMTGSPVGSIGPTRQRCLAKLRAFLGVEFLEKGAVEP